MFSEQTIDVIKDLEHTVLGYALSQAYMFLLLWKAFVLFCSLSISGWPVLTVSLFCCVFHLNLFLIFGGVVWNTQDFGFLACTFIVFIDICNHLPKHIDQKNVPVC